MSHARLVATIASLVLGVASVVPAVGQEVKINVTNATGGMLGNREVLIFTVPVNQKEETFWYQAWQHLNPGEGGTSTVVLPQKLSAEVRTVDAEDGETYVSNRVQVDPGFVSVATTEGSLRPTLGPPSGETPPGGLSINPVESGVYNNTSNPPSMFNVVWYLNDNPIATTIAPLTRKMTNGFTLQTRLYLTVDTYVADKLYYYEEINDITEYVIPPGTKEVNITADFDEAAKEFVFRFEPPSYAGPK